MLADGELIGVLSDHLGAQYVTTAEHDQEPYVLDWRGRYHGRALAVVKPASTEQVAAVVRLCAGQGVAVVPQGGNTGMCGAATPGAEGRSGFCQGSRQMAHLAGRFGRPAYRG